VHLNGRSTVRPTPDSLIIYPPSMGNIVGHIGVISIVGDDYVCVADQNRYFHKWNDGEPFSRRFPLTQHDGRFTIEDHQVKCSGWISFADVADRTQQMSLPSHLTEPPKFGLFGNVSLFAKGFWGKR